MSKNILFLSTMYPNPLRPGTPVCHYFAKEWQKMGYEVLVIHYRSMFPVIYTFGARLLPWLAKKYIGNHVEMDRNMEIVKSEKDGIPVYSIPIYKYFPHGRYSSGVINKKVKELEDLLKREHFVPDAIIGHFYNPQLEIVAKLKEKYPYARTCVSLHEEGCVVKQLLGKRSKQVFDSIDVIGFRSVPIKESFEKIYGNEHKSVLCWSGTPDIYIKTPLTTNHKFTDGAMTKYLYVGQTIKRKYPKETLEGVHRACGNSEFHLTYVGTQDLGYAETKNYVDENNLNDRVTFTGKLPREEIIKIYDQSDCFILISREEVFGLVYLEAMSRGCITIAARNEGMEGIIEHGVNGFLCKAGDAEELASIIQRVNRMSEAEKKSISEKARAKATELSDYNVAKYYIDTIMQE